MPVELTGTAESKVALLRLRRPKKLNALSADMLTQMESAINQLRTASALRAVVVTGEDTIFSAGADIGLLSTLENSAAHAFSQRMQTLCEQLASLPIVSIAAVEGAALGGGMEIAMACDLRVAARNALFGVPEVRLGLFPAAGGTARLVELLGRSLATQLLLTGESLPASVLPRSFFARLTNPGEAEDIAIALGQEVSLHPSHAVHAIKDLMQVSRDVGHAVALELEATRFQNVFGDPEVRERLQAFLTRHA